MKPPFLLALPAVLLLAACGDAGRSTPAGPTPRDPLHLVVYGTDREMGLQHGKALAKEIREEVGPRLKARFRAVAKDAADAKFLDAVCRTYTARTKELLPAGVARELAGIAEGAGVSEEDILLLEVMREGLRFHVDSPPLVEAALASPPGEILDSAEAPGPGGPRRRAPRLLVAAWDGTGGAELTGHALVLERRPEIAPSTMVVTWPGGLGAFAGVNSNAVAVVQGEVLSDRVRLSMNRAPFSIGVRRLLQDAGDASSAVVSRMDHALNGNRVLALQDPYGPGVSDGFDDATNRMGLLVEQYGSSWPVDATMRMWVLAPAGRGGDAREEAQNRRLGAYPGRPDATQTIALAVAGRALQAGAVLEVTPDGITWHRSVDESGKDTSPPIRFPFPSPK